MSSYNTRLIDFISKAYVENPYINYVEMHQKYNQLWNQAQHNNEKQKELLKLYVNTRDKNNGKGFYTLSYYMLETITYHTFETRIIPIHVFHKIINYQVKGNENTIPFGSWKDIKHFLSFFIQDNTHYYTSRESIIDIILLEHVIPQLIEDRKNKSIGNPISLCGKWMPRERSKTHGWLAKKIAILYYYNTICITNKTQTIFKHYRYLIRDLNEYLSIPQIHMCKNEWDKIDFQKITPQTIQKYKSCFLNENEVNEPHRYKCKENLKEYWKTNHDTLCIYEWMNFI